MEEKVFSYASLANVAFLEDLYQQYQKNPDSVDATWRYFFSGMEFSLKESPLALSEGLPGDLAVFRLIQAYRSHGHKKANTSPVQIKLDKVPELELSSFGLGSGDLERSFTTFGLLEGKVAPLSQIIERLEKIYCNSVGFEFVGLGSEIESWMISQIESRPHLLSNEDKMKVLTDLNSAEFFESFIHTKYPGQTRFSLEGGETLIPMINFLVEEGANLQAKEIQIGMTHRGRLNVLVNVLGKSYEQVFHEFEDTADSLEGSGDVKYHKGAHSSLKTRSGLFIEAAISPNPSHLESVDPVVEGQVRAKQDLKKDEKRNTVIPLIIHGDASLAGQGVVYELLQMGRLKGYTTGGTIHMVVNNHIGYTTLPKDSRSTLYCTDIAKTFGCPVFHVNAEYPEECVAVAVLALQIRQIFHVDVFIDLNCYRKYGHNEGDEPTFTQPLEYKKIREKKSIREIFKTKLIQEGLLNTGQVEKEEDSLKTRLQEALTSVLAHQLMKEEGKEVSTSKPLTSTPPRISKSEILSLAESICHVPDAFHMHPKLQRLIAERLKMMQEDPSKKEKIDWGMGEHLAFASLLSEKVHVRLSGQDVGRGTFSHRHAAWIDQESSLKYIPLNHVAKEQASFALYDSPLSEFAVMGFDLGYSLSYPKSLVLWEAQFGDFVNGAQVVIDQYLATSEQKWAHRSNLTLLLPHGYEGKGPEHSSARLERFLQLCAQDNLIIANCTTPSQFFHLLRRQAYLSDKRPLIVFTPKVLLRYPACVSSLEDFTEGCFKEVLQDPEPPVTPKQVIFCSGKVFYDLLKERTERKVQSSLIVRVEQLYPFPEKEILESLKSCSDALDVLWVQEEHKNMGAWMYIQPKLQDLLKKPVRYAGREEGASPAAGSYAVHKKQYERFMNEVFNESRN